MIPCTDFIPAYSELFRYIHDRGGAAAVDEFWNYLADNFLHNLRDLAARDGIRGCWTYWSHTLNEEAADFTMELDEQAGTFTIDMHACPSRGLLNRCTTIRPYEDYCRHCDVLYRRVLAPLGFEVTVDLSRCSEARCRLVVRQRGH